MLTETSQLLQAQAAEQAVSVKLELEPNLPAVLASPSALRQVFLNVAKNALQAMPHGGELRFASRSQPVDHTVEIVISDTGIGVPDDARAHLFEPFFTTRPEGTGLGLAICREVILQHDGVIELVSGADAGAVFRVVLPTGQKERVTCPNGDH